ncbi:hypothetical protein GCM10009535_16550 [Streptomyces thermocarboxydovorans]|uniref:Uncharacterized protein n=1 Tax=Streptomyces thermocarboxydovorans TaxID=59298 RepID=A0ABN1HEQ2_9ACTN
MLGSTHGTLTTDYRRTRAIACGERTGPVVHGRPAEAGDTDVSGRPLCAEVPDLDRLFRPESVAVTARPMPRRAPVTGRRRGTPYPHLLAADRAARRGGRRR